MLLPMGVLGLLCLFIGLGSPVVAPVLERAAAVFAPDLAAGEARLGALAPLPVVSGLGAILLASALGLGLVLSRRLHL